MMVQISGKFSSQCEAMQSIQAKPSSKDPKTVPWRRNHEPSPSWIYKGWESQFSWCHLL